MIRKHFRLKKIALGLAFTALIVAPTAQARPVLLDGHPAPVSSTSPARQLQVEGLRWQAMAKAYENMPGITAAGAALSNAKHSAYPVSVVQTTTPGITAAGAALSNAKHTAYPVSVVQTTTTSDSFNWSDAGIGASIAFGAALMLLIAVVLGRRFRSRPTGLAST